MGMPLFQIDKMTFEERTQAFMTHQPTDRVLLMILAFAFNGVNAGYTINEWYTDPKISLDSGRMTAELYGANWLPFGGYPGIGPWELGGEMKMPKGEFDQCPNVEPAISNEEEAWALEIPPIEKLKETGYLPFYREFARIATSQGVPFVIPEYCPWTTAGNIFGIERLSRWVLKQKDLAHHAVRLATDFLVAFNQIIADEEGPQAFFPSTSTASAANNIISPKTFKEFALPYLIEYHNKLIEMGVPGILFHLCGEQNLNYEFYPEVPLPPGSVISISQEVDLDKASATFPDYPIAGNVNPSIVQLGKPEEVYEASRIAIEKGKKHKKGFALATGCELPPQSPPYNVWMMAKAVNDFGYYD
jgi:uroporphyrinogen decarboxylase